MDPILRAHTIKTLSAKRAELVDELDRRQAAVRQCKIDLDHIDGAIRLLSPNALEGPAGKPKTFALALSLDKGQFAALIFGKLRTSQRPCSAREVALYAMEDRGLDTTDHALVKTMTDRACASLRYYRNRGVTRSTFKPGKGLLWEVADNGP